MLVGFTDSDWDGDPDDRNSTAGHVFSLGSGPITWACKKQQALALSSSEAEYRAVVNANQEALWLQQIVSEFGFEQHQPTPLGVRQSKCHQACQRSSSTSTQQTH